MKKIQTIGLSSLRVEEDFGFLKLIVAETAALPAPEAEGASASLTAAVTALTTAFTAFDTALKDSASTPSATLATEADTARDNAWRAANNYLKAMTAHPTTDVARSAAEAETLFDKYGDPTKLPQTEESGVLHNLLQDLKALDSARLTAIAFDAWLTQLEACEDAFLSAVAQRTEEEAARQVGIVKESRQAADTAYRSLTDLVNALAVVNGDAPYATFIDHVNAIIDRQKSVLKARATNNSKKKAAKGGE